MFDQGAQPPAGAASPLDPSSSGDLARQAGVDDIGRGGNVAGNDGGRAGLFDTAANDQSFDADFGGDGGFDGGGDTA